MYGNSEFAIKELLLDDITVGDAELNSIMAFTALDLLQIKEKGCYCKAGTPRHTVQLKFDKMRGDLISLFGKQKTEFEELVTKYQTAKEIPEEKREDLYKIFKLNQLFKISSPIMRIQQLNFGHFDIRPSNFLFRNLFQYVLADLATIVKVGPTVTRRGTRYICDSKDFNPTLLSDIYALGFTLLSSIFELNNYNIKVDQINKDIAKELKNMFIGVIDTDSSKRISIDKLMK